jgi:hypothetical protein
MPTVKKAGASAQQPMNQRGRGATSRAAQATRTTGQGAAATTSAQRSLSSRQLRK